MTPPPSPSFWHLLCIYIQVTILFIICYIIFVNAVLVCIIFLDNGIPALLLPHRTLSHGSYSWLHSGTVVEHNIFPSMLRSYANGSNICGSSIKTFFTGKFVNVLFSNVPGRLAQLMAIFLIINRWCSSGLVTNLRISSLLHRARRH